ncbi:MAG TPA: recombinase family protein [bacterium]|jgi:hypothetical protein
MTLIEKLIDRSQSIAVATDGLPKKAYAWARVSTEAQAEKDNSIPQQLKEIREYADSRGYEIIKEFHEAASAFSHSEKRVEFNRMVELAKGNPNIGAIIVHDLSRFSRDSVEGRRIFRELETSGVKVLSVNDHQFDSNTEAGVYLEAITFAKNEAYSRAIAFHTIKGSKANIHKRDPQTGRCYKNGARPTWGFKTVHVQTGLGKGGIPAFKAIWELDDTIVNGRPLHEWVRECLLKAMNGATCESLRDYCNETGIHGRKDKYWNLTSWKDLLYDFNLMKYAGYGVWNVRGPGTRLKPISEWEVEPDAHPAIISEEEALKIIELRAERRKKYPGFGRASKSDFLLSGGIAICSRCGRNLMGHKNGSGAYYVCGSEPYRKGKGCGKGVYIPQLLLESEVIDGVKSILGKFADPDGFTRKVNAALKKIWKENSGHNPNAEKEVNEIDKKIDHIRISVESGLDDIQWANSRLAELRSEKSKLSRTLTVQSKPPHVDSKTAMAHRSDLDNTLKKATLEERKLYLQKWLESITLFPDSREVLIAFKVPDSVMNSELTGMHLPGKILKN